MNKFLTMAGWYDADTGKPVEAEKPTVEEQKTADAKEVSTTTKKPRKTAKK